MPEVSTSASDKLKVDIKDDLPASVDLLEKTVTLEGVPERTLWTGLAPKVKVQLPKRR